MRDKHDYRWIRFVHVVIFVVLRNVKSENWSGVLTEKVEIKNLHWNYNKICFREKNKWSKVSLIITWNFLFFDMIINTAHYFAIRKILIAKK